MKITLSNNLPATHLKIFCIFLIISKSPISLDAQKIDLVVVGQALVKVNPDKHWENPYASLRPILKAADVGFTNFEMAVDKNCGLPENYQVLLGKPAAGADRPGNTSGPHAVNEDVMAFLSSMNFNLQSLANNHSWDLGDCGTLATIEAANKYKVTHAGTGSNLKEATDAAIINIKGIRIALVASTTSRDERELILAGKSNPGINGVWTGWAEDWERNILAVKEAKKKTDFVIYYQHFQIDQKDADGIGKYGHKDVGNMNAWQEKFAKAIIDAGADMYIAHGDRIFDGVEIYKGKSIFRQFGGFSYQGLQDKDSYDSQVWEGVLGKLKIKNGKVRKIEIYPLSLNEGDPDQYGSPIEFREKRGLSELATGNTAKKILERFRLLSAKYETKVTIGAKKAKVRIPK